MVAYTIAKDRWPEVAEGRQSFLLLNPRKPRSPRHARFNEDATLRPGGKASETRVVRICGRATIHLDKAGVARVLTQDGGWSAAEACPPLQRFWNAERASPNAEAETTALAQALGFEDWAELFSTYNTDEGRDLVSRGVIALELVAWRAEEAARVETQNP